MTSKPIVKFRLSDSDLESDPSVSKLYDDYCDKRSAFKGARKSLFESNSKLHDALDGPLRSGGSIRDGQDWSLIEDEHDGLVIQVWSEPKLRGRRRSEIPVRQLSFGKGLKVAS